MIFRGKVLSDLQERDIKRLVDDQVQERDTVEYKRDMYGNSDDDKRELLRDITAMANNRGGYIFIGIDEDDEGNPIDIIGVEQNNNIERIQSCCLDNIDKRVIGLEIIGIPLSNGKIVVVISIPNSFNAPHMVAYKGLNQFWKRHGKQKDRMTIDEIGEAFDKKLSNINSQEKFLFTRKMQILEKIGDQTEMVMSFIPAFLHNEYLLDIKDSKLRELISNPPQLGISWYSGIFCGSPYPTIKGLRADNSIPYYNEPSYAQYIEVFSSGYIEFGKQIKKYDEEKSLPSLQVVPMIVDFLKLVQNIYEQYLPFVPGVVSISILNARGLWLAARSSDIYYEDSAVKWTEKHLDLGPYNVANFAEERKMLTKKICDNLWQAFNREKCNLFDDAGTFIIPK